jgi:hypothetical protein
VLIETILQGFGSVRVDDADPFSRSAVIAVPFDRRQDAVRGRLRDSDLAEAAASREDEDLPRHYKRRPCLRFDGGDWHGVP